MKRNFMLAVMMLLTVGVASARFSVGVRDNRHIYGQFLLKDHYAFKLEQSVYAEKPGFQTLRGYFGYQSHRKALQYSADAYFGSAYNRSYCTAGLIARAKYTFIDRIFINAAINPHYDSTIGYNTCFSAGAGVVITKMIDVMAGYTTIPEYRMSEKRVQAGFDFHVGGLSVCPRLSVSVTGADKGKTLRALISFNYDF